MIIQKLKLKACDIAHYAKRLLLARKQGDQVRNFFFTLDPSCAGKSYATLFVPVTATRQQIASAHAALLWRGDVTGIFLLMVPETFLQVPARERARIVPVRHRIQRLAAERGGAAWAC